MIGSTRTVNLQRPTPPGAGRFPACGRAPTSILLCAAVAGLVSLSASAQTPASRTAAPQLRNFQKGVRIDWQTPAVCADGRVVLREGPLEYVACFPGKEHESVVLLECSATHLYMALGMIGLSPGHPPRWDDASGQFQPPAGDLVDIHVEWDSEGRHHVANVFDWLSEIEYARPPIARPWVFAGSQRLPNGNLTADRAGDGVAVVDKPDALLALSRGHVSRNAELWAAANAAEIPPLGAAVQLLFRPATFRERQMRVDHLGILYIDGSYATYADGADIIALGRRLSPEYVQTIKLENTLQSDQERLRRTFAECGVRPEWRHLLGSAASRRADSP